MMDYIFRSNKLLHTRSEDNLEDLCVHLRNQQICTYAKHNYIKWGLISIWFLLMLQCSFAIAAQVLLYKLVEIVEYEKQTK